MLRAALTYPPDVAARILNTSHAIAERAIIGRYDRDCLAQLRTLYQR
jgi:hypothetical protein